ncbi:hypothetical protein RR48_00643 [Papilio machaon]|uniref:Uncharacterized protein n=1 Tax=Papilio machaon TaxID=76193 RepID=A0A0N1IJA4_PAPMA|nr:hypothetical protein RR48_00643 [Papilio machaon]
MGQVVPRSQRAPKKRNILPLTHVLNKFKISTVYRDEQCSHELAQNNALVQFTASNVITLDE